MICDRRVATGWVLLVIRQQQPLEFTLQSKERALR